MQSGLGIPTINAPLALSIDKIRLAFYMAIRHDAFPVHYQRLKPFQEGIL